MNQLLQLDSIYSSNPLSRNKFHKNNPQVLALISLNGVDIPYKNPWFKQSKLIYAVST